jgi:DnaJ family protein C protein 19
MSTPFLIGIGVAGIILTGKIMLNSWKHYRTLPSGMKGKANLLTGFYRGGFDTTMSKREAGLILGIR